MPPLKIVLGNATVARYPQGGGHWMIRLQYVMGLRALGHEVHFLSLLTSSGDRRLDEVRVASFFALWRGFGLEDCVSLLLFPADAASHDVARAESFGKSMRETLEIVSAADLLWNDCGAVQQPFLSKFTRRVLVDLDPGLIQASVEYKQREEPGLITWENNIFEHHAFLTVGTNINSPDCRVPKLGLTWTPFTPFVHIPLWPLQPDPGVQSPFTSVTHWKWRGGMQWNGEWLSVSKREAYLNYLDLPARARRSFELAVNLGDTGKTSDAELLAEHGWSTVDPWQVADTPDAYQKYIASSRAEIACPKPIYRQLQTGWVSDRSVCYLAAGRPVLAEDTGFSAHLPTGRGLLTFTNMDEAVAAVSEIDGDYSMHSRAARELAEDIFSSTRVLAMMLAASLEETPAT